MQHDEHVDRPLDDSFVRHPIHATAHEAEHLREIADEGESAATPAILALTAAAFLVLLVALLITVVVVSAHFS